RHRDGRGPGAAALPRAGHGPTLPHDRPQLHEPEQSLDRHGGDAGDPRDLRQLLLGRRGRPGSDDERPAIPALPDGARRAVLRRERPDVMYLSLTDYIQHKHPPGDPVATRFYTMLDRYFDAIDREGAVLGITGDHGMNAKVKSDGTPNVVYLTPLLDAIVGAGRFRIILPITDPYVVHHGALGSFATIHLERAADIAPVVERLRDTPGVMGVWDGAEGCAGF